MPWYIYSLARGDAFLWGAAALAVAVLIRPRGTGRWRRILFAAIAVVAIAVILISAAALPLWFDVIWAIASLAWFFVPERKWLRPAATFKTLLLILIAAAIAIEFGYTLRPSPPAGPFQRLYVIGDSISAGLGDEHGQTWPVLIATEHHVAVVDLSRAGQTIATAHQRVVQTKLSSGLVVLEIGGNDMLGHATPPGKFSRDLESLVSATQGSGRTLVMLELPLLPFDDAYGIAQREIARRRHITLIPRRYFLDVLKTPGATVDGIHLSARGQRLLADMIWNFIGPCFGK